MTARCPLHGARAHPQGRARVARRAAQCCVRRIASARTAARQRRRQPRRRHVQRAPAQAPTTGGGPSLQVTSDPSVDLSENRRLVTVLFADLSGSTPLGEQLDPEDLRRILTSFFAALAREIQRYGGTVDKYIGDAIMAVFGAPVAHEDDAERAISAALAMQSAIAQLNDDLERRHGTQMELRIGINTGEVVAGLLAGDVQGAYTVVGDTVNTAQRFESAAPLGGSWSASRRFSSRARRSTSRRCQPSP